MSSDPLAEMAAEIERMADPRDKLALAQHATLLEAMAEIERLRARIAELEGQISSLIAGAASLATRALAADTERAVTFGTLAQPTPDEPTTITHGHPPTAPPHDE